MLYFITKTRRNWDGALLSVSYYNQAVDRFGAKCFATRFEFDEALEEKRLSSQTYKWGGYITIDMIEEDETRYLIPPDKVLTKDYYEDERMHENELYYRAKMGRRGKRVNN